MTSAFGHTALGATLGKLLRFLATASHGMLDALTTGGLGVAFSSPWELKRYSFAFRPILVWPISIRGFLGMKGLRVLASEARWVGLPCLALLGWPSILRRRHRVEGPVRP